MRRMVLLASLLLMPLTALAADDVPGEASYWHKCESDDNCVLVDGPCAAPTSVNAGYREDARQFYKERAKTVSCKNQFWVPQANHARCRLGMCEAVVQ